MSDGAVTLCIPAWQAEGFLRETLDAALAQDWPEIRYVISVDASADATARIAAEFIKRHGGELIVQPRRAGWVRNCNAALGAVRTRHAMILPHDDLILPAYVRRCMEALAADPRAVLAFSDVEMFGTYVMTVGRGPLVGDRRQRLENYLRRNFAAIGFRAVIDFDKADRVTIPTGALGDFGADCLWEARLAARGNLLHVPEPLYRKRYHNASTATKWWESPASWEEQWQVHVVELVDVLLRDFPELEKEGWFWAGVRRRLAKAEWFRHTGPGKRPAAKLVGPSFRQAVATYARVAARRPHYPWMEKR